MILAITNYDAVTKVLARYAEAFRLAVAKPSILIINPPFSDASTIRTTLTNNRGLSFFFFGHGKKNEGPIAQDGIRIFKSPKLLTNRLLCAICCFGFDGAVALEANNGATLLSCRESLAVPLMDSTFADEIENAFLTAPLALVGGNAVSVAVLRARNAYSLLAQRLFADEDPRNNLLSIFMSMNADLIDFIGDPTRTMVRRTPPEGV